MKDDNICRKPLVLPPPMSAGLYRHLNQYKSTLLYHKDYRVLSSMIDSIDFLLNEDERVRKGVV